MVATLPYIEPKARLTITSAAKLLGVHRVTLNNWIRHGKVKVNYSAINSRPFIYGDEVIRCWSETL